MKKLFILVSLTVMATISFTSCSKKCDDTNAFIGAFIGTINGNLGSSVTFSEGINGTSGIQSYNVVCSRL